MSKKKYRWVKSFTIKLSEWAAGRGLGAGRLMHQDTRKCCLGIYLAACGVSERLLKDKMMPRSLIRKVPRLPAWLVDREHDSTVAKLADANDTEGTALAVRKRKVAEGFKKQGIKVRFVD